MGVHRRRGAERHRPDRCDVRLRARGHRARPDRDAKGVADGPPLSAVTGRAEIMDAPHVSAWAAPTAATRSPAAALATLETIETTNPIDRAGEIERPHEGPAGRLQADDDRIGDVRGRVR